MNGEEMAQFEDLMGIENDEGKEEAPKFYLGPPSREIKAKTNKKQNTTLEG